MSCWENVELVPLPMAYDPLAFWRTLGPTRRLIADLVARCRYLQFAFWGLVGDWGAVAGWEALKQRRPFALHADAVQPELLRRTLSGLNWRRRVSLRGQALLMDVWHSWLVRRCALGLWHGPLLANVHSDVVHREEVPRLIEERLRAVERVFDIELALDRCRAVLPISADAVARWNKDDPDSWGRVRAWLTTRVVGRIMVGTTFSPDV